MIRLFRVFVPTSVAALLLSETILILACYALAGILYLDTDPAVYFLYEGGLARLAVVVVVVLLGLHFQDLYSDIKLRTRLGLAQQLLVVLGILFISQALVSYIDRDWGVPKWILIYGSAMVLVFIPLWRSLYSSVLMKAMGSVRVLFLGHSQTIQEIAAEIKRRAELGFTVLGYLDDSDQGETEDPLLERLGTVSDLRPVVAELKPDRIVVGMTERRQKAPVYDLLDLRLSGIMISEAASLYETAFLRVCSREIRPSQLIYLDELGPNPHSASFQSMYSTALAAIGLILAAPLMLLLAALVKLTSRGPVLYGQKRVGRNNHVFTVYKFRSMVQDAERLTGAVWAQKNDPRITPLGGVLRKYRLDELPQLINVIRGEMALVGPRPERPEFVKTLSEKIPFYRQRHCVKPGLTGWAQINYKYGDTLEDVIMKLEYDLYYIKNLSFALDIYIIFHTLKTVLLTRGAQ